MWVCDWPLAYFVAWGPWYWLYLGATSLVVCPATYRVCGGRASRGLGRWWVVLVVWWVGPGLSLFTPISPQTQLFVGVFNTISTIQIIVFGLLSSVLSSG